jgi:hypothetical protein
MNEIVTVFGIGLEVRFVIQDRYGIQSLAFPRSLVKDSLSLHRKSTQCCKKENPLEKP